MSKTHDERSRDSVESRIEVGKEQLRLAQLVLTAYAEGLGLTATAERIGKSRKTAWKLRVWLGVQSGRQWRSGERCRRPNPHRRASVEAVRP